MNIEVLVATMNLKDDLLYNKMGLKTNAIFANQTNYFKYEEIDKNGKNLKIISTMGTGVGKNRNIALLNATGDICIFSDDDITYVNNYEKIIQEAFQKLPKADIIIFNIDDSEDKRTLRRQNKKIKKVKFWNCLNYGAVRIVVRRKKLLEKNIWFSLLYGGGAIYSSGEDSLFLVEALTKKMKIYTYPSIIGKINYRESTWFNGYDEKFYIDKGFWIANAFPRLKKIILLYFSYQFSRRNKDNFFVIYKLMMKGSKKYS